MEFQRLFRLVMGVLILGTVLLGHLVNHNWLILTGIFGLGLIQSAFTNRCLVMEILKLFGAKEKQV